MENLKDENAGKAASVAKVDMKLEAIVIPVSDVDRAQEFTPNSVGDRTSRRQTPACSSSRHRAPRAQFNSARTSPRRRQVRCKELT